MANTVIIGMQWGDEGKGKIVDLLAPAFDAVARFQGGNNAGHTVKFGEKHFALHLIPSGAVRAGMLCVLGNGMVIDPGCFFEELDALTAAGIDTGGRLFIANRAHVLLPMHVALDCARETASGATAIGTTSRGIGPAYESKASRVGVRMRDLTAADFEAKLAAEADRIDAELERLGGEHVDREALVASCQEWAERLGPMLRDGEYLLNGWIDEGKSVLFEGAQGTLLDLDHGTYPYVTSSSSSVGGAAIGTGVAPGRMDGAVGILKAYTTRVGGGPFVTELEDDAGELMRKRGDEFGTTTGRPRRCGWFDAVVARHSRMINGVDTIALTKMDILDAFDEILVCTGYRIDGQVRRDMPSSVEDLERAEPVYRSLPGWKESIEGVVEYERLPANARRYVEALEEEVGAPIGIVSTGPKREETVVRESAELERLTSGGVGRVRNTV